MTKKKAILTGIGLVLMAAVIVFTGVVSYALKYDKCVTRISITRKNERTMILRIGYVSPLGGCSVRNVPEDEGQYVGDGMADYDGALGRYRIMLNFGDMDLADFFVKKMDENRIFTLADGVRAKIARPSDHGFVLYIGCDKPISVTPVDYGPPLNGPFGIIKISISVGNG